MSTELSPDTLKRIERIELPTHEEVCDRGNNKETSAIDIFIYNQEPAGEKDENDFRNQLQAALTEARIDEATRAAQRENIAIQAFEQISRMTLERGESDYKYAFNRVWNIAVETIKKLKG